MKKIIAATVLAATALLGAGTASASTADAEYVVALMNAGVPLPSNPASAINAAHEVCRAADAGLTLVTIATTIYQSADWTKRESVAITMSAVNAYCPEYNTYRSGTSVA